MTYPQPFNYFGASGFESLQGSPPFFYYNVATDKMHYSLPAGQTISWPQISGYLRQDVTVETEIVLNITMQYWPGPLNSFLTRLIIDNIVIFEQTDGYNGTNYGGSVIHTFSPGPHTIEFYTFSPGAYGYTYGGYEVDFGITDYSQLSLHPTISEIPDPVDAGSTSEITVHVDADILGPMENVNLEISTTGGTLSQNSGTTNSLGEFRLMYTSPAALSIQEETISVRATKLGHIDGTGSDTITIIPTLIPAMRVYISKCPEQVISGETLQITAQVTNNENIPVANANVELSVTGGNLNQINGTTDVNGTIKTIYTAPEVIIAQTYTISAIASREDYIGSAIEFMDITINPI